ncbi:hypothetical protein FB45DRAFT_870419 [Roridomyces roridus]|uniref:Uncharacterized protein n=1 Tax=Roridomyces roridus TaxID=1738132 RepID=A0AAD7BIT9_9AGAR|nr:hypothetical protein FB45DRAFT_870419 [Roridomyces roridus]
MSSRWVPRTAKTLNVKTPAGFSPARPMFSFDIWPCSTLWGSLSTSTATHSTRFITGSLLLATPPGVHVLQFMLAQHRGVGSVIGGSSRFFEAHTRYDDSPRLTFFNRVRQNPAVKPEIPVILEGRQISSVADIPPPPPPPPRPKPKPLHGQSRTRKTQESTTVPMK